MKLTFLGTGTSTGVPEIGCNCDVCTSDDPHDKRLRASVLIEDNGHCLLIDCGPDLRTQLLNAGSPAIDAMLITHAHYDHVGGLIDLRSYAFKHNFPIYCQANVERDIREYFPYCFVEHLYPGVPTFEFHNVEPFHRFEAAGFDVLPLPVYHAKLKMLCFRIGSLAYVTDCKTMPDTTIEALKGVDTLVINALRIKPHHSHMNLEETLAVIERIKPSRAYLTHISHGMGRTSDVTLPPNVSLAYDMQVISC